MLSKEEQDKLVNEHLAFARFMSQQMSNGNNSDDLFQEACLGLMIAARKFDPSKGVRFSDWAKFDIKARVLHYIIVNNRIVNFVKTNRAKKILYNREGNEAKTEFGQYVLASDTNDPDEILSATQECSSEQDRLDDELKASVAHALNMLTELERKVVIEYYFNDKKLREIGEQIGSSAEWARQLRVSGLNKMRSILGDFDQ